jgi:hypothetical protein
MVDIMHTDKKAIHFPSSIGIQDIIPTPAGMKKKAR